MRWRDRSDSYERDPIPWAVKNQLFMVQKGRCAYCGRTHRIRYLEIDHRWPVSRGGGDEISNLQLLCTPCNMRKGIQSHEEFRSRYWRLLPDDDSIPYPPIPQDDFTGQTQSTRASREVRSIYHRRFSAYRKRQRQRLQGYGASQPDGAGIPAWVVVLAVVVLLLLLAQC